MDDKLDFEEYLFLRMFSMDIDDVRYGLAEFEKPEFSPLRYRLLRDAIVSYGRIFSKNYGKKIRRHSAPISFVPAEHLALHKELISLRDQRFAHSDLTVANPRIARWKTKNGWAYPISFKGFGYERFEQRLDQMRKLVRVVRDAIERDIMRYEEKMSLATRDK